MLRVIAALATVILAGPAMCQDEIIWQHGLESTESLTTAWGSKCEDIKITLNEDAAYIAEGDASVHLSAKSVEDHDGNHYVSVKIPAPGLDMDGKMVVFNAWTSLPDATRALYVRGLAADGGKVLSWNNWGGILGSSATHEFELQTGVSMGGMSWEEQEIAAAGQPVTVLEVLMGTNQHGVEFDLFVDNLRVVPAKYKGFAEIDEPAARVPDTTLVEGGAPTAIVIRPETGEYDSAVAKLIDGVKATSGADLPVQTDAAANEDLVAAISAMTETNVVLVGNINSNRAMLPIYSHGWCFADALFPGDEGYELRTIANPWGTGKNVVVIGGDAQGVSEGVDALLAAIGEGDTLTLGPTVDVKLTGDAKRLQSRYFDQALGDAYLTKVASDSEKRIANGAHTGLSGQAAPIGEYYAMTGRDDYARAYVQVMKQWKEHHDADPGTYGGPWGMDADFTLYRLVPGWDAVEESPAVTDEDRLAVMAILFEFTANECVRKVGNVVGSERVRHNHQTFPALGVYFAGEYFERHYSLAEAVHWLETADAAFGMQAKAWKPWEDCNGYQWLTLGHLMRYALAKPDLTYFENGNARKDADLAVLSMDNLGYSVTYGDTGVYTGWWSEIPVLQTAAWYYDDAGYRWTAEWKRRMSGRKNLGQYQAAGETEVPERLAGLQIFDLDPYYHKSHGGEGVVELEKSVDKVVMREGFGEGDQYLLLDGLSNGGHRHYDGNSISRWTDNERIWLCDADYIKSLPKYHNGVLILKDGSSQTIPNFCVLDNTGDLPKVGLTTTSLPEYAGVDWRRNILWLKGHAYIVADQMVAREEGSYSFRPIWQTVGSVTEVANGMLVEQGGQHAAIVSPPAGRAAFSVDALTGKNWGSYKYSGEPLVRVMQQIYNGDLGVGNFRTMFTVLRASGEQVPDVVVSSPREGFLYAEIDGMRVLAGAAPPGAGLTLADMSIEADAFLMTPELISVFGLRNATYGVQNIEANEPIDVEIDVVARTVTIDASTATTATVPFLGELEVPAGRTQRDLPAQAAMLPMMMGGAFDQIARMPTPPPTEEAAPEGLAELRKTFSYREQLTSYLLTGNAGAIEAVDALESISAAPEPLEANVFGGAPGENRIEALTDGVLDTTAGGVMYEDGQAVSIDLAFGKPVDVEKVVVKAWYAIGSSKGKLFQVKSIEVKSAGEMLAEITDTEAHPDWGGEPRTPQVYELGGIDTKTDGLQITLTPRVADEIELPEGATAPENGSAIYIAEVEVWGNGDGLQPAGTLAAHTFDAIAVSDVDGDGADEIIAGNANGKVSLLSADGAARWSVDIGGAVNTVAAVDIIGEGRAIVVGAMGGTVTALAPDGSQLWQWSAPYYKRVGHIRTVFGANLGGDKQTVIAGSDNWHYYALSAEGEELWHYESVHGSTAGAAADVDGDGIDEVALGTEYYWWHLVNAEGERLWNYSSRTGPTVNACAIGDMDGDGKAEVLFGGADSNVHAISSAGELLWKLSTADEVSAIACADVDGDGADEAIVASLSFNVYALKAGGDVLWRRDLGMPVNDMCISGDTVCVTVADGRVVTLDLATGDWTGSADLGSRGIAVAPATGALKLAVSVEDGNLYGITW